MPEIILVTEQEFTEHKDDTTKHVTPSEKARWNETESKVADNQVKWNAGYDTSTRYQGVGKTITNWNDAVQNGIYMANNATNAPDGAWYIGHVICHAPTWVVQRVMAFTDPTDTSREFERTCSNGVWSPWYETSPRKLFTSVSNGKTAIASAISDKGVYTSPVETFANMANNIRVISTGKKFASGSLTTSGYINFIRADDYPVGGYVCRIDGLNFKPSAIVLYYLNSGTEYRTVYAELVRTGEYAVTKNNRHSPTGGSIDSIKFDGSASAVWAGGFQIMSKLEGLHYWVAYE